MTGGWPNCGRIRLVCRTGTCPVCMEVDVARSHRPAISSAVRSGRHERMDGRRKDMIELA